MLMTSPGLRPSPEHLREREARQRGERIEDSVVTKRKADEALAALQREKLTQAREQRAATAPERVESARQAISAARGQRALDQAFAAAVHSLRR